MRVAPVGLFYHDDLEQLRAVAYGQSQITHAHELGKEGAVLQAYAVALATNADPAQKLDSSAFLKKLEASTRNEVYRQKLERVWDLLGKTNRLRVAEELGNGVEAYNSVPAAIYSFLRRPDSFEECVLYAISLGGDTDTIGAMTGAISGAYHGVEAIPEKWKSRLEARDYIEKLAEKLLDIKRR
jgi:poly(ADP-ribose) glycohydrolase ARH3